MRPLYQGSGTRIAVDRAQDHCVVVRDLVAQFGDRSGEAREPAAHDRGGALALDRRSLVGHRRLDQERVHQVLADRDEAQRAVAPDEDPDLLEALDARQVVAPADLAAELGLEVRTEEVRACLRVEPVRADDEVVGSLAAI